jgi:hypothetical protein
MLSTHEVLGSTPSTEEKKTKKPVKAEHVHNRYGCEVRGFYMVMTITSRTS